MSITVKKDLCIGCGTCAALCPDAFALGADGKAQPTGKEDLECAKNAAASCPVQAIEVK